MTLCSWYAVSLATAIFSLPIVGSTTLKLLAGTLKEEDRSSQLINSVTQGMQVMLDKHSGSSAYEATHHLYVQTVPHIFIDTLLSYTSISVPHIYQGPRDMFVSN